VMWKYAERLSGAVCPLPQGTPWVFFMVGFRQGESTNPVQSHILRWKGQRFQHEVN
jgi:hypothetical protein